MWNVDKQHTFQRFSKRHYQLIEGNKKVFIYVFSFNTFHSFYRIKDEKKHLN